jgi:anti-sigma regulatory factor (Ser/Thr protein kinase)
VSAVKAALSFSLPALDGSPAAARQAVRALPALSGFPRADDLDLLVTETVTNAVRHPQPRGHDRIELDAQLSGSRVRVEVRDGGRLERAPELPEPGDRGAPGWGLLLVETVADRWGIDADPSTRVWFELDAEGPRPPAA